MGDGTDRPSDLQRLQFALMRKPLRTFAIGAFVCGLYFAWSQSVTPVYRSTAIVRIDDTDERDPQLAHRGIPAGATTEAEAITHLRSSELARAVVEELDATTFDPAGDPELAAANARESITVTKQQHQPGTLAITASADDPAKASEIAEAWSHGFVESDVARTRERAAETTRILETELDARRESLAELEAQRAVLLRTHPDVINADASSLELAEREGAWEDRWRETRARRRSAERALLRIEAGVPAREALAASSDEHPPEIQQLLTTLAEEERNLRDTQRGAADTGYRKSLLLRADDYKVEAQSFATRVGDLESILAAVKDGDDRALARLGGDLAREGSISVDWSMRLWITELERTRSEIESLASEFTDEYPPLARARARAAHFRGEIVGGLEQLLEGQRATLAQKELHATFWRDLYERFPKAEARLVEQSIAQVRGEIAAAVAAHVDGLVREEETARKEHESVLARLTDLASAKQQLASVTLECRELDAVVGDLVRDVENARIAAASIRPTSRIVDEATTPRVPLKPRPMLGLVGGLILGLLCALGWACVEAHRDGIFGGAGAGVPVVALGHVAARGLRDGEGRKLLRGGHGRRKPWLPLVAAPDSEAALSYRSLRARLRAIEARAGRSFRTIGVAGLTRDAGGSTVAASLAMARAHLGDRVLLVDANINDPSLRSAFEDEGFEQLDAFGDESADRRGIAECLDATAHWTEVTTSSGFPTLDLLDAGASAVATADLFASGKFTEFLGDTVAAYDVVVLDLAPFDASCDVECAAPTLDAVVLVQSDDDHHATRAEDAQAAVTAAGGSVVGVVRTLAVERRVAEESGRIEHDSVRETA